jgi:GMP synthase-like glutamine amidotransferase
MPLNLKILLTNDDDSAFAKAYPDDGLKVAALLGALRPDWRFEVLDLPAGQRLASLDGVDGVVVTGSPASVNDERLPWLGPLLQTLRELVERRTPTVGLCFGHQALAKALGGRVDVHTGGWGLGLGLTHWHSPAPWMSPPAERTWLMAAHREQVTLMPPGARCVGSSDVCPVASMAIGDHAFTTQFHPEMTRPFMVDLLGFLKDEVPAATLERAHRGLAEHRESSALFAQWMVRFLERDFHGADDGSTR